MSLCDDPSDRRATYSAMGRGSCVPFDAISSLGERRAISEAYPSLGDYKKLIPVALLVLGLYALSEIADRAIVQKGEAFREKSGLQKLVLPE